MSLNMNLRASLARIALTSGPDINVVAAEELARHQAFARLAELGWKIVRTACPGEASRPARLDDVIIDRGEYVGDGVPRDGSGSPYEPLDWKGLLKL